MAKLKILCFWWEKFLIVFLSWLYDFGIVPEVSWVVSYLETIANARIDTWM